MTSGDKKAESLSVYAKLQQAREMLSREKISKSGLNKYSNYRYFELGDFLTPLQTIMKQCGITTVFNLAENKATLEIFNTERPEEKIGFSIPVASAGVKGASEIQNLGAEITYLRRYLHQIAFEIAESDGIDGLPVDKKTASSSKFTIKKQVLSPTSERWQGAGRGLASGKCDLELIKAKFLITAHDLALLEQQVADVNFNSEFLYPQEESQEVTHA